ncbi:MAG: hypothetical protein ACRD24_12760 [Terriglobales bacterium]
MLVFGAPKEREAAAALGERPAWHFLVAAAAVFGVTFSGVLATLLFYLKGRKKKDEETSEITSPAQQPEQQQESPPP